MSSQQYEPKLVLQQVMGGESMAPEAENLWNSTN